MASVEMAALEKFEFFVLEMVGLRPEVKVILMDLWGSDSSCVEERAAGAGYAHDDCDSHVDGGRRLMTSCCVEMCLGMPFWRCAMEAGG